MKKTSLMVIGVFIIGVLSFYALNAYIYNEKQEPNDPPNGTDDEVCAQVVTDARDPETNEIQTFPTPCDVPEGWDVLETDPETFSRGEETWLRYRNDDLGVRFEYRTEPDGYTLVEQRTDAFPEPRPTIFVSLYNTKEYMEALRSNVPREGPPGISVAVYEDPDSLTPEAWVMEEEMVSNRQLIYGEIETLTFSGVPAVRYTFDGLYTNDTIVAHNNGRIYMITGSYAVLDSAIRTDFLELLEYAALY